MFCSYFWTNGLGEFTTRNTYRGWKIYHGTLHNTCHGGNNKTYHHVIFYMPENPVTHLFFPKFSYTGPDSFREVLNFFDTKIRDKMSLNGLGGKIESVSVSVLPRTGM